MVERPRGAPPSATRVAGLGAAAFAVGLAVTVLRPGGHRLRDFADATAPGDSVDGLASTGGADRSPDGDDGASAASAAEHDALGPRVAAPSRAAPTGTAPAAGAPGATAPASSEPRGAVARSADAPDPAAPLERDAAPPVLHTGPRRVEPGRVAYLRCDGVPQRPGPTPCPRDEALESAVWSTLDTLLRCDAPPEGLGESDLRLELVPGQPTAVRLGAVRAGRPRLEGAAILRCLAGPLSHVQTRTGSTRLVVSFRFELVAAAR